MPARIVALFLSLIALACGSKKRVEPPAPTPVATADSRTDSPGATSEDFLLDGKGLYDRYCASCHGGLEQSSAARASSTAIQTAMENIPEMQGVPLLQDEQVNSLVAVLSKVPPGRAKNRP